MIDKVVGKITAAPTPMTSRAATSPEVVPAAAPAAVAVPKMASPVTSAARRPYRSDRLPAASTKAAKVRL